MYHHPSNPGGKAAEVRFERPLHVGNGSHATDGGHVTLVEVAEGGARLLCQIGGDGFAHIIAHLHGGLRDAWDLMTILLEVSEVAEDEDFRQAGGIEIVVDNDAAAPVDRCPEHFAEG